MNLTLIQGDNTNDKNNNNLDVFTKIDELV